RNGGSRVARAVRQAVAYVATLELVAQAGRGRRERSNDQPAASAPRWLELLRFLQRGHRNYALARLGRRRLDSSRKVGRGVMHTMSALNRLMASTILGGALAVLTATAFAQEDSTSASPVLTEVVVTGSRIPQPNTEAISPIQTVGQQEFKLQGTVNV